MENITVSELIDKIKKYNNIDDVKLLIDIISPYIKTCVICNKSDLCMRFRKCGDCNHYQCFDHKVNHCSICDRDLCKQCLTKCDDCGDYICNTNWQDMYPIYNSRCLLINCDKCYKELCSRCREKGNNIEEWYCRKNCGKLYSNSHDSDEN
jgi:hypothetical protein